MFWFATVEAHFLVEETVMVALFVYPPSLCFIISGNDWPYRLFGQWPAIIPAHHAINNLFTGFRNQAELFFCIKISSKSVLLKKYTHVSNMYIVYLFLLVKFTKRKGIEINGRMVLLNRLKRIHPLCYTCIV